MKSTNKKTADDTDRFPFCIPADVPADKTEKYKQMFNAATGNTGRLMLFAGDQKVEHLNDDFSGTNIASDDSHPEHLFQIAAAARVGVFATQMGLICRYARQYSEIPFLVKLNSKTNIVPYRQNDPVSRAWYEVSDVVRLAHNAGIHILGVGYTVYPGSDYEAAMLREAARIVHAAHQQGLLAVLWMYPKGKAVKDEHDGHLIAGAAGIAACLGADFAKLKVPQQNGNTDLSQLPEVVAAAGNTGVLCEGGDRTDARKFLTELHQQIHLGGARGSGTGRNIHQRKREDAIRMANAIYAVTVQQETAAAAAEMLQ